MATEKLTSRDVFQLWETDPMQRIPLANVLRQGVIAAPGLFNRDEVVRFLAKKAKYFLIKIRRENRPRAPEYDCDFEEQVARTSLRYGMQLCFRSDGESLVEQVTLNRILIALCDHNTLLLCRQEPIKREVDTFLYWVYGYSRWHECLPDSWYRAVLQTEQLNHFDIEASTDENVIPYLQTEIRRWVTARKRELGENPPLHRLLREGCSSKVGLLAYALVKQMARCGQLDHLFQP